MKVFFVFLFIFISHLSAYDKTMNYINNIVLKNINGQLESKVMKPFGENGYIVVKLDKCLTRAGGNHLTRNSGTRIYTDECFKEFKNDYYQHMQNLNRYINDLNSYLTKQYNQIIKERLQHLHKRETSSYFVQSLGYTIDNINYKKEYNNLMVQINESLNNTIDEATAYDKTFGFLDNINVTLSFIIGGTIERDEHSIMIGKYLSETIKLTTLLSQNLTESIKEKFREDISSSLNDIY